MDARIERLKDEIDDIRERALSIGGALKTEERVQSSNHGYRIEDMIIKYSDLTDKLDKEMENFILNRRDIIDEIYSIEAGEATWKYQKILYERYVNYKSFEQIAYEMNYEYKWTCRLHGYALQTFDQQVLSTRPNTN